MSGAKHDYFNHNSWTKQCTSLPPDPLALHLLISNFNFMNKTMHIPTSRSTGCRPAHWQSQLNEQNNADLCFHDPCPGSDHFQSHDINKTMRMQASQAPIWNLAISNYISLTNKCWSMLPIPLALKWLFLTTPHEQNNADLRPVGLEAWNCIVLVMKCKWKWAGPRPVDLEAWNCIVLFMTCDEKRAAARPVDLEV